MQKFDLLHKRELFKRNVYNHLAWRNGGVTAFYADNKRSISHFLFYEATVAVAPNRKLSAGVLPRVLSLSVPLYCRLHSLFRVV
jgi:hypothetical protein